MRAAAGALAVANTIGGRAADAIDGLASSLRHRLDASAEARALSAQSRLSAVVVGAAPIGYLAFSSLIDPGSVTALVGTGVGRVCLVLGLALEGLAARVDPTHRAVGAVSAFRSCMGCSASHGEHSPRCRSSRAYTGWHWRNGWRRPHMTGRRVRVGSCVVSARSFVQRALSATGPVGRVVGALHAIAGTRRRVDAALERELPIALDLLGVAIGAGCTPYLAVEVASRWAPPLVAASFASVLGACALGASFDAALDDAARAAPRLRPLVDALLASDRLGAPVGPALARLAAEERAALRRRAETHARRVPVRLLFPLVFLVLPAFVLLTVVPGLAAGLSRL